MMLIVIITVVATTTVILSINPINLHVLVRGKGTQIYLVICLIP